MSIKTTFAIVFSFSLSIAPTIGTGGYSINSSNTSSNNSISQFHPSNLGGIIDSNYLWSQPIFDKRIEVKNNPLQKMKKRLLKDYPNMDGDTLKLTMQLLSIFSELPTFGKDPIKPSFDSEEGRIQILYNLAHRYRLKITKYMEDSDSESVYYTIHENGQLVAVDYGNAQQLKDAFLQAFA